MKAPDRPPISANTQKMNGRRAGLVAVSCLIVLSLAGFAWHSLKPTSVGQPITTPPKPVLLSAEPALPKINPGEVKADLIYCSGQLIDIYQPRALVFKRSPVVLYLHGGGWTRNDKASEPDQLAMIDGLRDKGFAVASINYRQLPDGYYPSAIEDSLCAVRFLRAQADNYTLDGNRIGIYGFSAGGYLAAMVGGLPDGTVFETPENSGHSSRVQAVVTLAGIFDLTDALDDGNRQRIANFLHGVDPLQAEAVLHVSSDDPPYFLIHGNKDQYVSMGQDDLMAARLDETKVRYQRLAVLNGDHGLNPTGGELSPSRDIVRQQMESFFETHLMTNKAPKQSGN